MKRISIVVDKSMSAGQKANIAAILAGQLAKDAPHLYEAPVIDQSGICHSGIAVNIVVLEGGSEQLLSLIKSIGENEVMYSVFSSTGQSLSNSYPEYQQRVSLMDTRSTGIIGIGLAGEDSRVKLLTKKFSLMK